MKDHGIDIRAMLVKEGWKIEECQENADLKAAVETLELDVQNHRKDREEIARRYILLDQQFQLMKCKVNVNTNQLKRKEEMLQNTLIDLKQSNKEIEEWKEKYLREKKETESLRKQIESMIRPSMSQAVEKEADKEQIKVFKSRVILHKPSVPMFSAKLSASRDELRPKVSFTRPKMRQPTTKAAKPVQMYTHKQDSPDVYTHPRSAVRLSARSFYGTSNFAPFPPRDDSSPGKSFRRRHRIVDTGSNDDQVEDEITIQKYEQDVPRARRISCNYKLDTSAMKSFSYRK